MLLWKTASFSQLAKALASETGKGKMSAQTVENAVETPITIIIPCHRVIGTYRSPTRYAGVLNAKKELLILKNTKINITK